VRFFGTAGFAILTVTVSASCAAVSGLDGYGECTSDCGDASRGPSVVPDASDTADSSTTSQDTSVEETSAPVGDASEALPEEGTQVGDTGLDGQGEPPPVDANAGDVVVPPVDAGVDAVAPVPDAGVGGGPTCGPLASRFRCNANQVCCASLAAQTNACEPSASCNANATLQCSTASDCPTSKPICCAQMSLVTDSMGDLPPKCVATALSASCASSCNDISPPSSAASCAYTGTVRLCSHDADCSSSAVAGGAGCYNFNGAPVSWCSTSLAGLEGTHEP
jgi:hypothetical protein